jgi:hypothetical protein
MRWSAVMRVSYGLALSEGDPADNLCDRENVEQGIRKGGNVASTSLETSTRRQGIVMLLKPRSTRSFGDMSARNDCDYGVTNDWDFPQAPRTI